uniref:Unc-85 n=1 Tax=Pristionchus pacificus TaxID=54126 RepID=A0A8R1U6E2_PRIPA
MGSRVNVCSVNILNNPSLFTDDFKLEITFEAYENLPHDLEWELVYVGSSTEKKHDQRLDSVEVGPTPEGRHKFVFEAVAADPSKIPSEDLIGVTALLLKVKYNAQEFLNLGWYVKVEYKDPELIENPPSTPVINKLSRTVLIDDLRVTTYPIKWDENQVEEYPPEVENPDEDLIPEEDEEEGDVSREEKEEGEKEKVGDQKDGEEDIDIEASDEEMEEDDGDNEGGDKTETDANKLENGEDASAASANPLSDSTNVN